MKYIKYLVILLFIVFLWVGNYYYHKAVFDFWKFKKSNQEVWKLWNIKQDYLHFFVLHDTTPLYTFKNWILTKYAKYSYENNKNWLIFPNQETAADLKYIQDIQYLASFRNTYEAKQLYSELNYVTDLSPFRVWIYTLWLLLIPTPIDAKENNFVDKLSSWNKATTLWEKWVFFNCNKSKIKNILSLNNKDYFKYAYSKSWTFYKENKNPCKTIDLPSQLWFNYFYYQKDLKNSVKNYKIAGFMQDALPWVIWMVAVVNWMLWQHEKWMYLLLEKAANLYNKLKNTTNKKQAKIYENSLNTTIKRAQAELNFYIISKADQKHPECKKNYECLVKNWYIKNQINILKANCSRYFNPYKIKSFEDLFSQNISYSLENAKCFLLWLNAQNWYIKNWKLHTVLRKTWTYFYDPDLQTWWEK